MAARLKKSQRVACRDTVKSQHFTARSSNFEPKAGWKISAAHFLLYYLAIVGIEDYLHSFAVAAC